MTNTQFYDDFHKIVKNRAYSYETNGGQIVKKELHYSNVGPTSLMTTVEDLAKWSGNFQNFTIGNPELIKQFNKVSTLDNNEPVIWAASPNDTTYHAKGQLHWKYKGVSVISHGGHDAGFRAVLIRFPGNGLSIITLSNNEQYPMLGKVLPVADLFLSVHFKETPGDSEAVRNSNNDKGQKKYSNAVDDFAGVYTSDELNTEYLIKVVNGRLVMTHQRLSDIILTEVGKDKFSGTNTFAFEMDFLRSGRNVVGFEISNFGAKRVKFRKAKS